ncbi:unnamed protein product [Nezara viridula]|uniref:Neuropeptide n=1 Tax=Nezara viridula TaxID=85310 RepID=A0A9P0EEB6_NEZVI|nr:unnamed protein product [Nezara viridula]
MSVLQVAWFVLIVAVSYAQDSYRANPSQRDINLRTKHIYANALNKICKRYCHKRAEKTNEKFGQDKTRPHYRKYNSEDFNDDYPLEEIVPDQEIGDLSISEETEGF